MIKIAYEGTGSVSWVMVSSPLQRENGYAMQEDTIIAFENLLACVQHVLIEVLRRGTQWLSAQAIKAEVATL
jgi:hypothetical protein